MSLAPGPCASSMAAAAPARASATSMGTAAGSVVRSSRSTIIRAAILVALGVRCVYAPWAPRVRTVNRSHSGPFSPKRMVKGLLGSPFSRQSPCTSG